MCVYPVRQRVNPEPSLHAVAITTLIKVRINAGSVKNFQNWHGNSSAGTAVQAEFARLRRRVACSGYENGRSGGAATVMSEAVESKSVTAFRQLSIII
jgi:hypothetical protein